MNQRTKKIISLFALAAFAGLILVSLPHPVSALSEEGIGAAVAQGMFGKMMNAFRAFTASIVDLVATVTAFLITFAAYLINLMIDMSTTIIDSPLVKTGFGITLQIANMGFVVAIIALAFVTIFRLQGYETKKIFRNLILAAVLVNFSFTIAGLVMDGSHVFAKFFLQAMTGDGNNVENITANLAHSLNLQQLNTAKPSNDTLEAAAGAAETFFLLLTSLVLTIIYNSAIVITFFTIAGMMFVRYVIISLLLILMPAAWLCWIFPALSGNWKKWWDTFLRWNIFLPVMLFFLYLALRASEEIGASMGPTSAYTTAQAAAGFSIFSPTIITAITQGLVQIGLIFGGMMAANSLGIAGAGFMYNSTKSFAGWATGAGYLQGRWQRGFSGGGGGKDKETKGPGGTPRGASWLPPLINRKLGGVAAAFGLQSIAAGRYAAAAAPSVARRNAAVERAKEINQQFSGKDDDSKKARASFLNSNAYSTTERAARAMVAVDGKMIDDLDGKKRSEYLQAAGKMGVAGEIVKKRLDLAGEMDMSVAQVTKDWTVKDITTQDPKSFESSNVMANLDPVLLEKVVGGKGFSRNHLESVATGLASLNAKEPAHENNKHALSPVMRGVIRDLAGKIEKMKPEERTMRHEAMLNLNNFVKSAPPLETKKKKGGEERGEAAEAQTKKETAVGSPRPAPEADLNALAAEQAQAQKRRRAINVPGEKIKLQKKSAGGPVDDLGNPIVT
ncbi:MAG: hypothetical protein AAB389_02775 [Patescibacteria group bacterium]